MSEFGRIVFGPSPAPIVSAKDWNDMWDVRVEEDARVRRQLAAARAWYERTHQATLPRGATFTYPWDKA